MFRKTIFWLHLGTGVVVGIVVAMMSLTGVLLTYERQLIEWADSSSWPPAPPDGQRQGVAQIAAGAAAAGVTASRVTFYRDPSMPALVGGGRRAPSTYVDQYSGNALGRPDNTTREIMSTLTGWHRWFDVDRDKRGIAQFVTGAGNLAFLFLAVSGAYLWIPKVLRWPQFRERLRFAGKYRNSQTRDFYWHHIFAAWSLLPLIVIVATAVVISFPWAHDLLTGAVGADPGRPANTSVAAPQADARKRSLDELLDKAKALSPEWNSIALAMPTEDAHTVSFEVDAGSGRQPQKRTTVVLNAYTGDLVDTSSYAERPAESRAIAMNRYLHTGEWFGVIGQTVAGLVSVASLFMVWTGFALAWRRLIVPLYRRS